MQITILRHKCNMQVYRSNSLWHDPSCGFEAQPSKWQCLGTEGWWADSAMRYRFESLKQAAGDMWPQYPGEYSIVEIEA